ncbi:glyoxalase/bleomycin resistance protein/dioxygenase [Microthyrium microscopicum]|uniref:Glyoxalase/bleomycin resistance protein/dioxygenase n=1 Tax=Microthyrium microscopicum TaxID=703497 RepID=A0A6A6TVN5_9PEZI|nr:glyoxalase/bleomycin resistance protein/dioxygenase [Microthyrium microscopicum]
MPIDHVLIKTTPARFDDTVKYYEAALAPLGYSKLKEVPNQAAGFGDGPVPDIWVFAGAKEGDNGAHVALRAKDHEMVRKYHAAALAAGGKDNGAPGPRANIHPDYYGAFVHDMNGNNIEVCCNEPQN